MLAGKKIVLGVTGGIAAYKAAEVISRLRKLQAEVHVIMTEAAAEFITPLTLRTLAGTPVHLDPFAEPKQWNVEHIALAQLADLVLVVPATADILAKMAAGITDSLLASVLLATPAPIMAAPAMNHWMYHHPATQTNLATLRERSVRMIGPATGYQACGTEGDGRMSEPAEIVAAVQDFFFNGKKLAGKNFLVTAGGTQEPLDPVRYLTNRSSGKMGYAVAQALQEAGAEVILVSTPTCLTVPAGVEAVPVRTALEMYEVVLERYPDVDGVVKAAAVADYRPAGAAEQKIKKDGNSLTLELVRNPDILLELGRQKQHQILIGFAAETENLMANAQGKMQRKNVDMLVANDVSILGAGFDSETNMVSVIYPDGRIKNIEQMTKLEIARKLVDEITAMF